MRKIKAISINGKPLTMCKLGGGGILMDKRKPTAYLFGGGYLTMSSFTPITLNVGDTFEVDYELLSPTSEFTKNTGYVITRPEDGIEIVSVRTNDLSAVTPKLFAISFAEVEGARHILGLINYSMRDEQMAWLRLLVDGQTMNSRQSAWYPIVSRIGGSSYGAHCIVHGVRINGGEWISLDELPGIQFYGNVTKVK